MTSLRIETLVLPAAHFGPDNPLPPLAAACDLHNPATMRIDESIPAEDREHLGWGLPPGLLPYRMQDNYDRTRTSQPFQAVVLENETLRATFLPCLGGRLWSLVHTPDGRELLARNPIVQPCNLALRNAWLSGGVEWNFGWTGHWPYNCSPLFAATFQLPDGTPGLRMWEWERVRRMPLQIDAWLPAGSPVLLVRVALRNPWPEPTPVYWWSNIAVEQHADVRVIAPADDALAHGYGPGLACVPVPVCQGVDNSYPVGHDHACDYFYRVPHDRRPWITAVNRLGRGLFQTSTSRLRGRKLFRWGTHPGGQAWQRFLGTPDYIELQAGLARTQLHHLPMPPGATWDWIEAYGDVQVDPGIVHGDDWRAARQTLDDQIERIIPAATLERALSDSQSWAATPPPEFTGRGSGWGALESLRRDRQGEPRMELPGIVFPADSLGDEQQPWRTLIETGVLPEPDPTDTPTSYQVQAEWMQLIETSLARPNGRHWNSLFHHGVMQWHWGNRPAATAAWAESLRLRDNPWAACCLGIAARIERRPADGVAPLARAWRHRPDVLPMAIEYCQALIDSGRPKDAVDVIAALVPQHRRHGRVRLMEGDALLRMQDLDALAALLADIPVPPDLREGERNLSDLWFGLHEARESGRIGRPLDDAERAAVRARNPCPPEIDFRMRE